jgi:hypothetical protein
MDNLNALDANTEYSMANTALWAESMRYSHSSWLRVDKSVVCIIDVIGDALYCVQDLCLHVLAAASLVR